MIKKIDHFVMTTSHVEASIAFYQALGFTIVKKSHSYVFHAGDFKINVHLLGHELEPHARHIQTGSCDVCFEVDEPLLDVKNRLEKKGYCIELGIVNREGAKGAMESFYLRDPDQNLIELSYYKVKVK